MKIGILCATNREAAPFLSMIKDRQTSSKAMLTFHEGDIEGVPVAVVFSGVCKVNAAIAAQNLIGNYQCDAMINAGTAGGIDDGVNIFDTIVSEEVAYHDVAEGILTDFHPWLDSIYFKADPQLLELAKTVAKKTPQTVLFGRMVTGEAFIQNDQRTAIHATYAPLCVDMETAAVAHVCYVNQIPFLAVRTISDQANADSTDDFSANCDLASQKSADFIKCLLKEIYLNNREI